MRILFITGNGDVISSFRSWRAGVPEPSQVSMTFSSQVFAFAELAGATMTVIGNHHDGATHRDGAFLLMHRPRRRRRRRGVRYYAGELAQLARILGYAARYRCRHLIFDSGNVPLWALAPLSLAGFRFVAVMHNTMWTRGTKPQGRLAETLLRLQGAALARCRAVLCVSLEVQRQVEQFSPRAACFPVLPIFYPEYFEGFEPRAVRADEPLHLFFAGRIERFKGVFDVLAAAEILERRRPGRFTWEMAGGGGALADLRAECTRRGLDGLVTIRGPLDRVQMRDAYQRCHAVVVPTRTDFPEGFCMVAAEGVLARRPVVTCTVVPAHEHLGAACLLTTPDDAASYADQIDRLASDPDLCRMLVAAGEAVRAPFFDRRRGVTWGLAQAFKVRVLILPEERPVQEAMADVEVAEGA